MAAPNPDATSAYDLPTLQFYSEEAPDYVSSAPGGASRHLAGFLDLLVPGSTILELGCGGGRDAEAMLIAGFVVEATDGVPEMAKKAQARIGQPVRVLRFDQLDASATYDAIWANASLLHVPRSSLPKVIKRIFRALRPGGFHFASFKGGRQEGRDRFGRYFNYLSQAELEALYCTSVGWEMIAIGEYMGGGYEGGQGPWLSITVRKPKEDRIRC